MELIRFLFGSEPIPVYRSITEREAQMLRALLGSDFHFELEEGEPMEDFLFQVLSGVTVADRLYSVPPLGASLLGTFELRDAAVATPDGEAERRSPPPRCAVH